MNLRRKLTIGIVLAAGVLGLLAAAGVAALSAAASRDSRVMSEVERHLKTHSDQLDEAVTELVSLHPSGGSVDFNALPLPLRAVGVRGVFVGKRHVTLFVYHSPDTDRGYRVWADVPSEEYVDDATSIPGVYRFSYCDDYPESPTNRAD